MLFLLGCDPDAKTVAALLDGNRVNFSIPYRA